MKNRSSYCIGKRIQSLAIATAVAVVSLMPLTVQGADEKKAEADFVPGEALIVVREDCFEEAVGSMSPGEDEVTGIFGNDALSDCKVTELMEIDPAGQLPDTKGDLSVRMGGNTQESICLVKSDVLDTDELIKKLENEEGVISAEPNYIIRHPDVIENESPALADPAGDDTVDPDFTGDQYMADEYAGINVPDWNDPSNKNAVPDSGKEIVVAVVDTGIMYDHPDLKNVMWDKGEDYPELKKLGGGKYGYNAAAANGYDKDHLVSDPDDAGGHGTHCAGVVAAEWNDFGVSGIANGAKLMSVRLSDSEGFDPTSCIISAYNYIDTAIQAGVNIKVITNSWCMPYHSYAFTSAIRKVAAHDVLICFSSGNSSFDRDYRLYADSGWNDLPNVITVNASTWDEKITGFTNYGTYNTDVFAPGYDVISTVNYPSLYSRYAEAFATMDFDGHNDFGEFTVSGCEAAVVSEAREGNGLRITGRLIGDQVAVIRFPAVKPSNPEKAGKNNCFLTSIVNEKDANWALGVAVNGSDINIVRTSTSKPGWANAGARVKLDKAGQYDLELYIWLKNKNKDRSFDISLDDLKLVDSDTGFLYAYLSGTSMACPAVAGEAAVLRARFPEETADKTAARIIGSVRRSDTFKEYSISGGIADLTLALNDEKTAPVLFSAKREKDKIIIGGYYFGSKKGVLKMDGSELTVIDWNDTQVRAVLPADFKSGSKRFEVIKESGEASLRDGHRQFLIGDGDGNIEAGDFTYLKPEGLEQLADECLSDMIAMDGKLYIASYVNDEGYFRGYYLREFDPVTQTFRMVATNVPDTGIENVPIIVSDLCIRDEKILFIIENESAYSLVSVDPKSGEKSMTALTGLFEEPVKCFGFMLDDLDGDLLLMGNYQEIYVDEEGYAGNRICRIDESGAVSAVGGLHSFRGSGRIISWKGEHYLVSGRTNRDNVDTISLPNNTVERIIKKEDGTYETVPLSGKAVPEGVDESPNMFPFNIAATECGDGVMMTGACVKNDFGDILCDTWLVKLKESGISVTLSDKVFSKSPCENSIAAVCEGKYYVMANTLSGDKALLFGFIPANDPVKYEKVTAGDLTVCYKSALPFTGVALTYDDLDLSICNSNTGKLYLPRTVRLKGNKKAGEAQFTVKKISWEATTDPFSITKAGKELSKALSGQSFKFTVTKRLLDETNTTVILNNKGMVKKVVYVTRDAKGKTKNLTVPKKDYEIRDGEIMIKDTSLNYRGRILIKQ